ncbi:MAG: hypothetical protein R3Y09_13240 [Clostridia bacterium]
MQNMSTEYNEQMKAPLRNESYFRLLFNITDPKANSTSSFYNENQMDYSTVEHLTDRTMSVIDYYGKIYDNGIPLDNSVLVPPITDFNYQGYVSKEMSKEDGTFDECPTLIVKFTDYIALLGMSITFDNILDNYPTEITINSYADGDLVSSTKTTVDKANFVVEQTIPEIGVTDEFHLIFDKTNVPFRDVRISSLSFGITKEFDNDNVKSFDFNRKVDLINSSIPVESFKFTFLDPEREYNPENPQGVWNYLTEGQILTAEIGQKLNDGSIEWQDLCKYYYTGEGTISASHIPNVTFTAISLVNYLDDLFDEGVYSPEPRTLYDLANEVMEFSNIELNEEDNSKKWLFNDVMKNYTTTTPIPLMNVNSILQLLAGACNCVLFTDRQGVLRIEPRETEVQDFELTFDDKLAPPEIKRYPILKQVSVNYLQPFVRPLEEDEEQGSIYNQEIDVETETDYIFDYGCSTNHSYVIEGDLEVIEIEYFAYRCKARLKGTGKIDIFGDVIEFNYATSKTNYNLVGDECPVEMLFINTLEHAKEYSEFVAEYIKLRVFYKANDRGFPIIDPLDTILVDTGYSIGTEASVNSYNLNFNGALSGTINYYKKDVT